MKNEINFNKDTFSTIRRTMKVVGKMIPAFICNGGSYFYTNLEVYSDGIIEAWGAVDLDFFKQKLDSNWVATNVPNGENISIDYLGDVKIKNATWDFDNQSFYEYVFGLIKEMNPEWQNIYNFHGTDVFKEGEVNVAKLGLLNGKPTKPKDEKPCSWRQWKGDDFLAFYTLKEGIYYLCNISVFPDESIRIDRIPEVVNTDFEGFQKMVAQLEVVTEIKTGDKIKIYGLGDFEVEEVFYPTKIEALLGEIIDAIAELNSRPTTSQICKSIYEKYCETPTVKLKNELKEAYENIPEHLRRYILGDMDVKDMPVRMIIYGEDEIQKWSHYAVAESEGAPLPQINVPKPNEE